MSQNLIDTITDKENFRKSYKKVRKGDNKYKKDAVLFHSDYMNNLEDLRLSIINGTYEFGEYNRFLVHEPKERVINAPGFNDKLVQMALHNAIKETYYKKFIFDSYSCIDEKGTHACAKKIQKDLKQAQWLWGTDATIIKIDISKFFYTIERDTLKKIIVNDLKCTETIKLIHKIIDSADSIDELGLPLGNSFSQLGANIYMNKVDHYAKRKLRLKFYVRYADDIVIVVESKDKAREVLSDLSEFIKTVLQLDLNINKSKMFPITQGVNTIGYKIKPTHMLLRNDSKKKLKRKIRAMPKLIYEGRMTISKAEQMLNSWKGHAEHANAENFIKSIEDRFDFIFIDHKGKLRVNSEVIFKEGMLNAV